METNSKASPAAKAKKKAAPAVNDIAGRTPPHSTEAEQAVLACCMMDPERCVTECVARCNGTSGSLFYDLRYQEIFNAMAAMVEERKPVDVVTLGQRLRDRQMLEEVGGPGYLAMLPEMAPSPENLGSYLEVLQGNHALRRLVETCQLTLARAYSCDGDPSAVLDEAERDIMAVRGDGGERSEQHTMKQLVNGSLLRLQQAAENKGKMDGLETGLVDWDRITGGLHRTELTVVGGMSGGGKSSLAVNNVAAHVALDLGRPVGVFSLEMSAESLVLRMLCSRARVDLKKARTGEFQEEDLPKLMEASKRIAKATVYWEDVSHLTVAELAAKARRMKQRHGVELVVVDYVQLVTGGAGGRNETEEQQISSVARALKGVAMELEVPVLALSQLNEGGLLRGSRAIGHHADNVARIYKRKDAEVDDEWADLGANAVPVELLVLKQRNGPTGKVKLTFLKCYTRFENAAKEGADEQ